MEKRLNITKAILITIQLWFTEVDKKKIIHQKESFKNDEVVNSWHQCIEKRRLVTRKIWRCGCLLYTQIAVPVTNELGNTKSSSKFTDTACEYLRETERGMFWNSLSEAWSRHGLGLYQWVSLRYSRTVTYRTGWIGCKQQKNNVWVLLWVLDRWCWKEWGKSKF